MISYPRFWVNTREYEVQDFVGGLFGLIASLNINSASLTGILPSGLYNMDGANCNFSGIFGQLNFAVKYQYFYLFSLIKVLIANKYTKSPFKSTIL
jgi:hypothetical protein